MPIRFHFCFIYFSGGCSPQPVVGGGGGDDDDGFGLLVFTTCLLVWCALVFWHRNINGFSGSFLRRYSMCTVAQNNSTLLFHDEKITWACHISNISIAQWRRDYPVVDSCRGVCIALGLITNVRAGVQPSHTKHQHIRFAGTHCSPHEFRSWVSVEKNKNKNKTKTPTHRYHLIIWYLFGGMFPCCFPS